MVAIVQRLFLESTFSISGLASLYEVAAAPVLTPGMEQANIAGLLNEGPPRAALLGKWTSTVNTTPRGPVASTIELGVHCADALRRLRNVLGERDLGIIQRVLDGDPLEGVEDDERADDGPNGGSRIGTGN